MLAIIPRLDPRKIVEGLRLGSGKESDTTPQRSSRDNSLRHCPWAPTLYSGTDRLDFERWPDTESLITALRSQSLPCLNWQLACESDAPELRLCTPSKWAARINRTIRFHPTCQCRFRATPHSTIGVRFGAAIR